MVQVLPVASIWWLLAYDQLALNNRLDADNHDLTGFVCLHGMPTKDSLGERPGSVSVCVSDDIDV